MQNKKKKNLPGGLGGVGIFSGTTQFTFDFLFNKNKLLFTVSQSLLFVLLLPFFFFTPQYPSDGNFDFARHFNQIWNFHCAKPNTFPKYINLLLETSQLNGYFHIWKRANIIYVVFFTAMPFWCRMQSKKH